MRTLGIHEDPPALELLHLLLVFGERVVGISHNEVDAPGAVLGAAPNTEEVAEKRDGGHHPYERFAVEGEDR
jgi:hypothetical protein